MREQPNELDRTQRQTKPGKRFSASKNELRPAIPSPDIGVTP